MSIPMTGDLKETHSTEKHFMKYEKHAPKKADQDIQEKQVHRIDQI